MSHATGTSVAFGPDTGLVVWVESHLLKGARIDAGGRLLDTLPIDISGSTFSSFYNMRPDVAWGGGRFLVAWSSWDSTMCALVDPDGHVVSRSVLQDTVRGVQNAGSSVDYDGTNFLVAWLGRPNDGPLTAYFTRVTPQGTVLDSPPRLVVPDTSYEQYNIAVAYHADRHLAVWHGYGGDLRGSFILLDGSVPDSSGFVIRAHAADRPAVTHNGRDFVACWNENPYLVKVARITDDGVVLDTPGICIDSFSVWDNDVFSAGGTTIAALTSWRPWVNDSTAVMAMRLDTALNRLDSAPLVLSRREEGNLYLSGPGVPSVAMCGDDYIVAWCQPYHVDSFSENNNAVLRRVTAQGQPVESAAVTVSFGPNRHEHCDLATDGDNYFAAWVDSRRTPFADSRSVRGIRFSSDGTILDSAPVSIGGVHALRPSVSFGGDCYLVVWYDVGGICAARVTAEGRLLDSVAMRLSGSEHVRSNVDVAYGSSVFLVAWWTWGSGSRDRIHGVRVTPAGEVLDSVPILLQANATHYSGYPQVGFDGANFLVTRTDLEAAPSMLVAIRVNGSGQVIDSADITIGRAGFAAAALAFGGGCYLVTDRRDGTSWRVSPEGVVLESVPVPYRGPAQVTFDGTDFMLLCERDCNSELGALRVAPDGRVVDSVPFILVTAADAALSVQDAAMAASIDGHVGLASLSWEPLLRGVYRIRAAAFPAIVGVQEGASSAARLRVWPSLTSRVIHISPTTAGDEQVRAEAFDAAGRSVMELQPGPNDVRYLPSGVYFIREPSAVGHELTAVTKVVITR